MDDYGALDDDYGDVTWEPTGFLGATAHDFDDHSRCDPRSCPNAEQEDWDDE